MHPYLRSSESKAICTTIKKITKEHVSEWRCREKGQYIKSCKLTMCMTKGFVYLQHTQNTLYSLHSILPFKTPSSNLKCESKEENSLSFPAWKYKTNIWKYPGPLALSREGSQIAVKCFVKVICPSL